ncbi:MAG: DUF2130 domain-containing protein [Candidatus Neomarinimicrobiota bacterium]
MNEIKCPNCNQVFKADEAGFADIQKQVRDGEFEKDLQTMKEGYEKESESAVQLAEAAVRDELRDEFLKKEKELTKTASAKDVEIEKLKSRIESSEMDKQIALAEALEPIKKERDEIKNDLKSKDQEHQLAQNEIKNEYETRLKVKDEQLKYKDEVIQDQKDMKLKLSTKMLGESLEQHCEVEFNNIRAGSFPKALFEKDNDASLGSKGDYIFRDFDENGYEITSIMFDMKNEGDETATKTKNEHFLKKLDKDRIQKNCEFAVLVSMLEKEDESYNVGIRDMSHLYEKMYVVRPQFFVPIITLIRNISLKSMNYKVAMEEMKATNIDITNFNNKIDDFKKGFTNRYNLYDKQSAEAIQEIDKAIKNLEKTKDKLQRSSKNLRLANDKLDNISVKKLVHGNPTMKEKFAKLKDISEQ